MEKFFHESNLQVTKSIYKILDTFFYFSSKKYLEKISVTEICKRASVSRKTFYNHYLDIYDLIDKISGRIAEEFVNAVSLKNCDETTLKRSYRTLWHFMLRYEKNYVILPENHTLLLQTACEQAKTLLRHYGEKNKCDVHDMTVKIHFILAGIDGTYRYWYNSCRDLPIDGVTRNVREFIIQILFNTTFEFIRGKFIKDS